MKSDLHFMRLGWQLARRGYGATSPNPMVGAVLVRGGRIIGRGWHHRAGLPHAEIEALCDAEKRGHDPRGATLYVTLEPCSTHGRTPPCTDAIKNAGIKKVVIGATDPNPKHAGRAFKILRRAGIEVSHGILADDCARLNEAFNHWIVRGTPFVTVKAGMTLDGKIATADGESKWITGDQARAQGMKLREGVDAILVGVNTILADNPSLTFRPAKKTRTPKQLRRIVLDPMARTPLKARVVSDELAHLTTIVVSRHAPKKRVDALARRANVLAAPLYTSSCYYLAKNESRPFAVPSPLPSDGRGEGQGEVRVRTGYLLDLRWLLEKLGQENVTSLLVEGGGETNASFLFNGLAQRVAFFYAPKILGGSDSRKGVAGNGVTKLSDAIRLQDVEWKKIGEDLAMTALVGTGKI